jgi:hypothetical protein
LPEDVACSGVGLVDVDEAEPLHRGKGGDLAGGRRHPLEDRAHAAGERVDVGCRRQLDRRVARPVPLRGRVALDQPVGLQRRQQAPRGAAIEAAAAGQLPGGRRLGSGGHGLQQQRGSIDRLHGVRPPPARRALCAI